MNRTARALLIGGALVAGPAAINALVAMRRRTPLQPLPGEMRDYAWNWGRVRYYVAGQGDPVLLLHGIYAGASAYEWRENFETLAQHFRVYAPDLLGFGLSEKPNVPYSANLYVRLVEDFMREVIGEPALVCASSLSAAFAVAAQPITPMARKLALVCPTGILHLRDPQAIGNRAIEKALKTPVYGKSFYYGLTSVAGIHNYLATEVYHDPRVMSEEEIQYLHAVAHQPGAHYAMRAFIAGKLNLDISYTFWRMDKPILLLWGRHARMTPVTDAREFQERNPRTDLQIFERSSLAPHIEEADEFNEMLANFFGAESLALRMAGEE
jgi:pimeloyl-ACP methyl ester carboxylesterase